MKQITFIQFPSGWRPPVYRNIDIKVIARVRTEISNNGNQYSVLTGIISDEDATFLTLADPKVRIKEVEKSTV